MVTAPGDVAGLEDTIEELGCEVVQTWPTKHEGGRRYIFECTDELGGGMTESEAHENYQAAIFAAHATVSNVSTCWLCTDVIDWDEQFSSDRSEHAQDNR
jgi:hypothetical protein